MVHLALGGLRSVGIPARYVSGYFHPDAEPVVGETVPGESHAWVEWWDDGWRAFDPTNDREPGDRYVSVATGRDYLDVKPLSGIYSGGGTSRCQRRGRRHPAGLTVARPDPALSCWCGRAGRATAWTGATASRGRSGLRRAGWWVTPTRGNPRDSATENRPPLTFSQAQGPRR